MLENHSLKQYPQEEEIDVKEVLGRFVRYIRSNIKLFLLFSLLGLAGGYGSFLLLPRIYRVSMIADSRILSTEAVVAVMESWQGLLQKDELQLLADRMRVSTRVVRQIRSIEAIASEESAQTRQYKTGYQNRDVFIINAEVYDTSIADSLQYGITYYLENSPFMKQRTEYQRESLLLLKQKIQQEMDQLDTVKNSVQHIIQKGGNSTSAFISEPGSINSRIVDLYNQLLEVNQNLQFIKNVQVISGFDRVTHPDSPKLSICLIAGLVVGIVLAFLLTFFRTIAAQ